VPAAYFALAWLIGGYLSFDLAFTLAKFAYVAAVVCVPLFVFLRHLGWESLHDHLVFGFGMGILGAAPTISRPIDAFELMLLGFYGLSGAVAGAGFWAITRKAKRAT
jgi:hypothetical protein